MCSDPYKEDRVPSQILIKLAEKITAKIVRQKNKYSTEFKFQRLKNWPEKNF